MEPTANINMVDTMIGKLQAIHSTDKFQFDFYCSQYISGPHNKTIRQQICSKITGQPQPASKSGLYNTVDLLKAYFEQYKLF